MDEAAFDGMRQDLLRRGWRVGEDGSLTAPGARQGAPVAAQGPSAPPPPTASRLLPEAKRCDPARDFPKRPEDALNKTERAFLGRLRAGVYGPMDWIGIQCVTLKLGDDTRYTPDFATLSKDGGFRFWEVKGGYVREDALVKLKTAAHEFPWWPFVMAQKRDGGVWAEKVVPS